MHRWKARVKFLLSVIELLFQSLAVEALQGKMCQNSLTSEGVGHLDRNFRGKGGHPPANILTPHERQLIALQFVAGSFYIMKLCSRLFVLYCRNCPKDDKFRYFIPILTKLEPWFMAHWKARVEFLLSVIALLFLSLAVAALQGKMCQNSLPSGGVGHLEPTFQGEGVVPGEYFLVSTKPDIFCYLTVYTEPCYVPWF